MADRRLQVFYTVARLLSFTKAAETLHMTQPEVTFQVRQLEEYFNTRLFARTHNRISLTDAGSRVYEYADKIFELYTDMENSVREMTGSPLSSVPKPRPYSLVPVRKRSTCPQGGSTSIRRTLACRLQPLLSA